MVFDEFFFKILFFLVFWGCVAHSYVLTPNKQLFDQLETVLSNLTEEESDIFEKYLLQGHVPEQHVKAHSVLITFLTVFGVVGIACGILTLLTPCLLNSDSCRQCEQSYQDCFNSSGEGYNQV